jgi:putative spermidine/putrescine transport system ATP-binding protein
MARVRLENLSKRFGATAAVDDVSLEIDEGELVALLGPSGCGKTTTLRMIAGFVEPDAGRIRIGERDVTHLPPYRRDTGMVFQGYALFPHLTVAQNVSFGLEMRHVGKAETRERVAETLRLVRLDGMGERMPRQLSGGQQQRVALARALVIKPSVFLLDEPLSNLDAKLRHDVRIEIRQLQQRLGLTTIFVTHDQEEALTIADRLVLMKNGVIQQIGTPDELYERPANLFVADFIGKSNFLKGELVADDEFISDAGLRVRCGVAAPFRRAVLAIRPEKIALAASPTPGRANQFPARIERLSYLGPTSEYVVRCGTGEALIVHGVNGVGQSPFATGGEVWAEWEPGAGYLLPEEKAAG